MVSRYCKKTTAAIQADEILETIETPDIIYEGNNGAKIAIKNFQETFRKFVVVVYRDKREGRIYHNRISFGQRTKI